MKAETYIDNSGKSWLVWWDKDGDKDFDLWTTCSDKNNFTHSFEKEAEHFVIWAKFEITKFPNGFYGFGYNNNFTDHPFEKVRSGINRKFENETTCLQYAFEHLKKQKIRFSPTYIKDIKEFLEYLELQINPKTLF